MDASTPGGQPYRERLERETRIELATNSMEGCDSTIELLPLRSTFPSIVRNLQGVGQTALSAINGEV